MTPEEQDKEIRKEIISILRDSKLDIVDDADDIMQLIAAWHNKQVEAKLAHISEYAENVISIDESGEFSMKAIPLSLVAAERNKLKGVK